MSNLKRLTETGSALERELVDSARYDGLSADARRRHLRLFGMSGTLLALLGFARDSAAAVAGASKPVLVLASAVGLVGVGGLSYAVHANRLTEATSSAPALTGPVPSSARLAASAEPAASPSADARPIAPQPERAGDAPQPRRAAVPSAATSHRPPHDVTSAKAEQARRLQEETALLMDVQALIRGGQTRAAGERLGAYHARFPNGQLRLEAEVVEVELMSAGGDKTRAGQRARALLVSQPAGPYSARLRAIEAAGRARAPAR